MSSELTEEDVVPFHLAEPKDPAEETGPSPGHQVRHLVDLPCAGETS
jgi:hypothetical protein